jgi:Polyketide cyclase / dehydrase and lipid transport
VTAGGRSRPVDHGAQRSLEYDLWVALRRPPAAVFALLADIQDHEPIPFRAKVRMRKEPPGPTAIGTWWHEQVRLMPGLWLTTESVVTELEEPIVLGMDFRAAWFSGHLTYTIEPTPEGCVVRQREKLRPLPRLRRLAGAIDAGLRLRSIERLADIRNLLERSA